MEIEYEVSKASLEEELENLVTHFSGVCFQDLEVKNEDAPDLLIQGSLVDVAEASGYDDAPLKEVFWRGSQALLDVYNTFYKPDSSVYQYLNSHLEIGRAHV